jgi:hypothetical protein
MRRFLGVTAIAIGLGLSLHGAAWAHEFTGMNELTGMMGFQAGLHDPTPGGFKLFNEYGYRLSQVRWLNLQLNFSFAGGDCFVDQRGILTGCGSFVGDTLELIGGEKFKWATRNPKLVPYLKLGGGIEFVFFAPSDSNGFALVFRSGGGLKYYVLRNLAVGGELDFTFGPGFYGCGRDCGTTVQAYAAFDVAGGVEFNF